jgi:hypothetical protein
MKFIVYETTNVVNGKKYRGAHTCENLDDNYLGSGRLILKAIAKYGFASFTRSILVECETIEDMFAEEAKAVDLDWVANPMTYNLKVGGEGGWDYINRTGVRWNEEKRKAHSVEMKKRRVAGLWRPKTPTLGFLGRKHSAETKAKISANSASSLNPEELEQRRLDVLQSEYPKRGSIKRLSELWSVSHTQVRRFLNEHATKVLINRLI